MTELLAPAGSWDALVAAVQSGADAVYMGFGDFNARKNAQNFTDRQFQEAVDYCHLRGVKVYLTLNTLVSDRELPQAAAALRRASEMGVDAVLIQDWGVFALAREVSPDLPVHASTQMSLFSLGGAREAAQLGMERVVLARELSREDIRTIIRGCPAEIEVFVHGALCMCYSGQCALSAVVGQRSGNRGRCAQPCRLPYGAGGAPCRGEHPLSLKDSCLADKVTELSAMGAACLKIEGRMKRPEYVALVTGIYRRLLDEGRGPTREEQRQLLAAFNRDGFTQGYYLGQKGPAMFGMRPENARWPEELFAEVRRTYENGRENRLHPVQLSVSVTRGVPAVLTARCAGRALTVTGPVPEEARSRALTAEELRQRLSKTGGTVFTVTEVAVELEEGLMLSAGSINALRRSALEGLAAEMTAPPVRRERQESPCPAAIAPAAPPALTASVSRPEQLSEALARGVEVLYLPAELLEQADTARYAALTRLCAVLPRVFRTEDESKLRAILEAHPEVTAVAVGNLGHLPIAAGLGRELRGDFGLNVYNSRALAFLRDRGLSTATVSFELRHQQVRDLRKLLPCEAIVYGRLPLMITENCVISREGCTHGAGSCLTDRTGARFPVQCAYGCRNELENCLPLYLADKPEYRTCGLRFARLRFTDETAAECLAVLEQYRTAAPPPEKFTRGLFYRGVE